MGCSQSTMDEYELLRNKYNSQLRDELDDKIATINLLEEQITELNEVKQYFLNKATEIFKQANDLSQLNKHKEALPLFREALEIRERGLGGDHVNTLKSMSLTAWTLDQLGRDEEALILYEELLKRRRRILGNKHENTLLTINNIGSSLTKLGRCNDAIKYYQELVEIRTEILGEEHEDTILAKRNMQIAMHKLKHNKS